MKLGACLWMEDDALPPDRERIGGAVLRIVGKPIEELTRIGEEEDGGDAFWSQYEEGIILCQSYPGNTAIYAVPGSKYDKQKEMKMKTPQVNDIWQIGAREELKFIGGARDIREEKFLIFEDLELSRDPRVFKFFIISKDEFYSEDIQGFSSLKRKGESNE